MLLDWIAVIVRLYMVLRKSIHWPKHVIPGTIGSAVPISTSNSLRHQQQQTRHLRKMFSVDSCQFSLGPCLFSLSEVQIEPHGGGRDWCLMRLRRRRESGSAPAYANNPFLLLSPFNRTSESKPKFLSPYSFFTMAQITPTTSLYLLWVYQRVGEPHAVFKIHNIKEYFSTSLMTNI